MRLIDADALHNVFERYRNAPHVRMRNGVSEGMRMAINSCKEFLDNAKTIDAVEVVHGRWETDKEDIEWGNSLKRKYCTNCGKRPHFDKEKREFILSNYCPNCGSKMDGVNHG